MRRALTESFAPNLTRRQRAQVFAGRAPRVLFDDFEQLLEEFSSHIVSARKIKVTDPKHDALIRTALRGFSLSSKIFKWDAPHFLYVKRRAKLHYEAMGDGPMLFFCLSAGYALGLVQESALTKPEFKAAEAHLDSIIRLNLQQTRDKLASAMQLK